MWTSISVQRLNGIGNSPSCSILRSLLQGGAFGRGVPSSTSSRILGRERRPARPTSPTQAGELEWPSDSPTDLVELASTATHTRHSTLAGSRSGASLSCWIVILNERRSKRCATNGLKMPLCFHCPARRLRQAPRMRPIPLAVPRRRHPRGDQDNGTPRGDRRWASDL